MHHSVNSRADLEKLRGSPQYASVLRALAGSMILRVNVAEYPEGYGTPEYEGPTIDPVWVDEEDLSAITRFDFTKAELLAELEEHDEQS